MITLVTYLLLAQFPDVLVRPPARREPDKVAEVAVVTPTPMPPSSFDVGQSLSYSLHVLVTASPLPKESTVRVLGSRVSKVAMSWVVSVENPSPETLTVYPSAVIRRMSRLRPFDHITMSLIVAEADKNSNWARGSRAIGDVGRLSAFLTASKVLKIKESWPLTLFTGAEVMLPYIISRFQGAAVPSLGNFEQLSWADPMQLGPGEVGTRHIFTTVWMDPKPLTFSIDLATSTLRKGIQ